MRKKAYRGGCWGKVMEFITSFWRGKNHPCTHHRVRGFRVARNVKDEV
jgi:formylglycine-generating enzyme required for sulfatase activity